MTPQLQYPELEISLRNFIRKLQLATSGCPEYNPHVLNEMRERILKTKVLPAVPDYRELCCYDTSRDGSERVTWQRILELTTLDELLPGGQKRFVDQYAQIRVQRYHQKRYDYMGDVSMKQWSVGSVPSVKTPQVVPQPGFEATSAIPRSLAGCNTANILSVSNDVTKNLSDSTRRLTGSNAQSSAGSKVATNSRNLPYRFHTPVASPTVVNSSTVTQHRPAKRKPVKEDQLTGSPPLKRSRHESRLMEDTTPLEDQRPPRAKPTIKFIHWSPR